MNTNQAWLIMIALIGMQTIQAVTISGPEQLGKQFLKAQNLKDQSQFRSILNQAIQQYRGNKEAFNNFLNVRDGYGCTSLLRAAALVDIDQIIFILQKLEEYFGTDGKNFLDKFKFINAQCLQGHTAFYLLVQTGTKYDVELMIYHVLRLIGSHKQLFYHFLTPFTYNDKWTPLHWLAYQGAIVTLEAVVIIAEKVLGKDSDEFEKFINAEDSDHATPLSNAYFNIRHKKFLLEHGATIVRKTPKAIKEARQFGLDLIEAIREDRFSTVQRIIANVQQKYKDQPKLFFQVFMVRSHGGWDPLMHAAALSYEYTAFILHVIENYFENDEESFYAVLRNVAQDGRGALYITILRRNFETSKLLIRKIIDYSPSKYFLYILMNLRTYGKGFTPLLAAVDFSSDKDEFFDFIKILIETVAKPFGRDSRAVDLFINTHDQDGFTPLAYATSPKITQILLSYGARINHSSF